LSWSIALLVLLFAGLVELSMSSGEVVLLAADAFLTGKGTETI
jgi:hypothetical protein